MSMYDNSIFFSVKCTNVNIGYSIDNEIINTTITFTCAADEDRLEIREDHVFCNKSDFNEKYKEKRESCELRISLCKNNSLPPILNETQKNRFGSFFLHRLIGLHSAQPQLV